MDTIYQAVELCDDVAVTPRLAGLVVTSDDPAVPAGERNLAFRAGVLLGRHLFGPGWDAAGGRPGAAIHIVKRIPMQAGLGGGSADAAAALLGLWQVWGRNVPGAWPAVPGVLWEVARALGADVPFGLNGPAAIGRGRGDVLAPVEGLAGTRVVLAFPPFGLSTADVYRWWDEDNPDAPRSAEAPAPDTGLPGVMEEIGRPGNRQVRLRNDLEEVVFRRYPALRALKDQMLASGARAAAMSGSGSTIYALAEDDRAAEQIAREAAPVLPGTRFTITRALGEA